MAKLSSKTAGLGLTVKTGPNEPSRTVVWTPPHIFVLAILTRQFHTSSIFVIRVMISLPLFKRINLPCLLLGSEAKNNTPVFQFGKRSAYVR
jgi:hypothetical protein